ncbi:hypothetical protein [Leptolyngbya sp. FACHB-261]|uniref:hypothetical protein n=1 Tax=Leptolyngbya sp. FACHB-261 TaxID=2692806 RepID=UPI001682D5C5|nr:hypothetical protein [Leptolyngbya sp. FACHB-261]MBD2103599.1 hypothetical protein [Leptolyngbya sp. FACHB-261]
MENFEKNALKLRLKRYNKIRDTMWSGMHWHDWIEPIGLVIFMCFYIGFEGDKSFGWFIAQLLIIGWVMHQVQKLHRRMDALIEGIGKDEIERRLTSKFRIEN